MVHLAVGRQCLRAVPQMSDGDGPTDTIDARDEPFTSAILLELDIHAGDPGHQPIDGPTALTTPCLETLTDGFDVGQELGADLVHDPVAEALHEAHHELGFLEQLALLGSQEPAERAFRRR